jgi:hypothetical protein
VKILEGDDREMYKLVEESSGELVLEIVLGDVGWYEMRVLLTKEEAARYREEGGSFVRWLVDQVRADPKRYER